MLPVDITARKASSSRISITIMPQCIIAVSYCIKRILSASDKGQFFFSVLSSEKSPVSRWMLREERCWATSMASGQSTSPFEKEDRTTMRIGILGAGAIAFGMAAFLAKPVITPFCGLLRVAHAQTVGRGAR